MCPKHGQPDQGGLETEAWVAITWGSGDGTQEEIVKYQSLRDKG